MNDEAFNTSLDAVERGFETVREASLRMKPIPWKIKCREENNSHPKSHHSATESGLAEVCLTVACRSVNQKVSSIFEAGFSCIF